MKLDPGVHVWHRHSLWQNCSDTESYDTGTSEHNVSAGHASPPIRGCQENDRNLGDKPMSTYVYRRGHDSEESDMLATTFRLTPAMFAFGYSQQIRLRRRKWINRQK
jgi:hypothetical protein